MHIKEIKNDLTVGKVQMTADSIIQDKKGRSIAPPLMNSSFLYIITGASGSGKTNLMINLLKPCKCSKDNNKKKTYYGMFDSVVVVSPSLNTLSSKENLFKNLDESKKFKKLDEDVFETVESLHEEKKHQLLILDDISQQLKQKEVVHDLVSLCKNRRHKGGGLSIMIILHKLSDAPPSIRANSSLNFVFKPKTKKETEFIHNEYIDMPFNDFKELLNYIFKDGKYNFLIIDTSLRSSADIQFYKNFNLLELN